MTYPEGTIIRAAAFTRINHWITAACFVLLVLSGLAMFHPLLFWLSGLFGGGQWVRAAHPWIGCVMLVSYLVLTVQFWRENLPKQSDAQWLAKIDRVVLNDEQGVPEVGRFNPGQKIVFWGMAFLVPVLFFTGILIWDVYLSAYTSVGIQRVAVLVHSLCAVAAIILWIVHVYAAIWVSGSMRAMMHGYVTPGWAWRHHRLWFRSLVAEGSVGSAPDSKDDPRKSSQ